MFSKIKYNENSILFRLLRVKIGSLCMLAKRAGMQTYKTTARSSGKSGASVNILLTS